MRTINLAKASAGVLLAAGLALSGCSTTTTTEREKVVTVTPPAPVVVTPTVAVAPAPQTFQTTIGLTPLPQGVMRLQSFAGDVCVGDERGNGSISHCVCEQTNCACQNTRTSCKP